MKKTFTLIAATVLLLAACQKKSLPVITERSSGPNARGLDITAVSDGDAAKGQVIFTNRCDRCHGLPETGAYTAARWESIVGLMAPRARLDKEQAGHVLAWVKANAKKN